MLRALRSDALVLAGAVVLGGGLLIALLSALGVARSDVTVSPTPSESAVSAPSLPPPRHLPVATIAGRVEQLRQLRFVRLPRVRTVREDEASRLIQSLRLEVTEQARRHPEALKRARRGARASADLLRLSGLVPDDFRLREAASGTGVEPGGFYDPKHEEIVIVDTLFASDAELEARLAHELTHALDDHRFGLDETITAPAEALSARHALVEGEATFVEALYRQRYLDQRRYLRGHLAQARAFVGQGFLSSPPVLREGALFPYVAGVRFVRALYRRGGWPLVNRAWRHPPTTSQQVLQPDKWLAGTTSSPVKLGTAQVLGSRWRRIGGAAVGEADSASLVNLDPLRPKQLAAVSGWAGGRFEDWRLSSEPTACRLPCRPWRAAVIGWRWRSVRALANFASALHREFDAGLISRRVGPEVWKVEGGYAALSLAPLGTGAAFAPRPRLALALARQSAQSSGR